MNNLDKNLESQQEINAAVDEMLARLNECYANMNSKRQHQRHDADNLIIYISQFYDQGSVPMRSSFFPVRCRNISSSGISFFFPIKPKFKAFVVQLGGTESNIYMEAKIMHVDPVSEIPEPCSAVGGDGHEYEIRFGSHAFAVGCKFLRRLVADDCPGGRN